MLSDKDHIPIITYDEIASLYAEKFMDINLYNETYDAFLAGCPKQEAAILEIGCGPGNITRYLLTHRPDLKYKATDLSQQMVELAAKYNPTAEVMVADCRMADLYASVYDGIIGGFCIPYLNEPECRKLIRDCSRALLMGGLLYLSFLDAGNDCSGFRIGSNGKFKMYIHCYPSAEITTWMKEEGFDIWFEKSFDYPAVNGGTEIHTVVMGRKIR